MKKLLFFLVLFSCGVYAEETSVLAIGAASVEKYKIVFADAEFTKELSLKQKEQLKTIVEIWRNDFAFYVQLFEVIPQKAVTAPSSVENYTDWNLKGWSFVVTTDVKPIGKQFKINIKVWNVAQSKLHQEVNRMIDFGDNVRGEAHLLANEIYKTIMEKDSIFLSEIIFVSDVAGSGKKMVKELYRMDFDGFNKKRLTFHNGIVVGPDISPDNQKYIYSLIPSGKGVRNVNLYIYDKAGGKSSILSNKPGLNSGAIFSADGNSVYLTLSHKGNPDIYQMSLATKKLRKITSHYGIDVDPAINRSGDLMTFLSSRSGRAMIYTMNPQQVEGNVKRISFVGQFNASPRFNPDASQIVFSSWVDNRFDIFRIGSDGKGLIRLTKNFGSNEEPSFSKDGQFIVFTSQRVLTKSTAVQDVYIMDNEGEIIGALTHNFGRCYSPKMSK